MDSSHYQIHTDRIICGKNINMNFLLCNICKNILWTPEQCRNCNLHFCKFCINFTRLKHKDCPSCITEYIKSPADHFLIEDLSELQIKCVYSYNGCTKVIPYDQIIQHEAGCIYRERLCEECNEKILEKYHHTHIIICKNSITNSLYLDCNQIISYYQDKFNKLDKDNLNDIKTLEKYFKDAYTQKIDTIEKLTSTIKKQHKQLEELINENNLLEANNISETYAKSGEKLNCAFL
jgi:hypothetical protein